VFELQLSAMEKNSNAPPRKPRHIVLLVGIWITLGTAAIWAGGHLIQKIEGYLPYALALGIVVLGLGFYFELRSNRVDSEIGKPK
jgi:hypothetical protein